MNKLRNLLTSKKNREDGFTLIELLIVIVIIGVLTAIAIPLYLSQQNAATDKEISADLVHSKAAVASYALNNAGAFPTAITTTILGAQNGYGAISPGYLVSADNPNWKGAVAPTAGSITFCIQAKSKTGNYFSITESSGVVSGVCA